MDMRAAFVGMHVCRRQEDLGRVAHPDVCTARVPTVTSMRLMLPLLKGAAAVNLGTFRPGPIVTSAIGDDTKSADRPLLAL